jgi:hypothetical protein
VATTDLTQTWTVDADDCLQRQSADRLDLFAADGLSDAEMEYLIGWRHDLMTVPGKPSFGHGDSVSAPVLSCPFCRSRGQIESRFHPGTCCNCGGVLGDDVPKAPPVKTGHDTDLQYCWRPAVFSVADEMDKLAKATTECCVQTTYFWQNFGRDLVRASIRFPSIRQVSNV